MKRKISTIPIHKVGKQRAKNHNYRETYVWDPMEIGVI